MKLGDCFEKTNQKRVDAMEVEKLIKMANQIGDFFEANPDEEEAKREIASHLKKFWNSLS